MIDRDGTGMSLEKVLLMLMMMMLLCLFLSEIDERQLERREEPTKRRTLINYDRIYS